VDELGLLHRQLGGGGFVRAKRKGGLGTLAQVCTACMSAVVRVLYELSSLGLQDHERWCRKAVSAASVPVGFTLAATGQTTGCSTCVEDAATENVSSEMPAGLCKPPGNRWRRQALQR
jgi:hypothetical protein